MFGLSWALYTAMTEIGFISLGCSKNLVDTEIMIGVCQEKGFTITNTPEDAEVLVINTCGFIDSAKEEAISTILEAAEYKTSGRLHKLIVTGCLAQRYKEEILSELPEVDLVVGVDEFPRIATLIENDTGCVVSGNSAPYPEGLPRILATPPYRAFLKISEGCDNHCTYCAIPSIRGPYRSRRMENILSEARALYESGVRELSIVAQDTTRYGLDLYGAPKIATLLEEIAHIGFPWIRLFYTYAELIDDALLDVMEKHENILPYLDIPIQHIDNQILRKMGRRDTAEGIRNLVKKIRQKLPDAILRTSLIVGFPGEDEKAFTALCDFVKEGFFDRLGVFKYSPEEGTPAARLLGQLDEETKEARRAKLYAIAEAVSHKACLSKIGTVQTVLVEGFSDMFYVGRSAGDGPEIDGKVYFTSEKELAAGTFVQVKMIAAEEYDMIGEVIDECPQ